MSIAKLNKLSLQDTNVKLYLKFNGTDGSTTFTDESGRHTVTGYGNAQLDTAQKKFGTASLLLDDTQPDYLTIPDSPDFDFCASTSGNYTISVFFKLSNAGNGYSIIFNQQDASYYSTLIVYPGLNRLNFFINNSGINLQATFTPDTDWHHIAVVKIDNEIGLYLDGNQEDYDTFSVTQTVAGIFSIGYNLYSTERPFDGWIDELYIATNNIFNASPNVGETDTLSVPTGEFSIGNISKLLGSSLNDIAKINRVSK